MQNEKMQINLDKDCHKAEVIIREVDRVNELPVLEPEKVSITGTIGAVFSFLEKRWGCEGADRPRTHPHHRRQGQLFHDARRKRDRRTKQDGCFRQAPAVTSVCCVSYQRRLRMGAYPAKPIHQDEPCLLCRS